MPPLIPQHPAKSKESRVCIILNGNLQLYITYVNCRSRSTRFKSGQLPPSASTSVREACRHAQHVQHIRTAAVRARHEQLSDLHSMFVPACSLHVNSTSHLVADHSSMYESPPDTLSTSRAKAGKSSSSTMKSSFSSMSKCTSPSSDASTDAVRTS